MCKVEANSSNPRSTWPSCPALHDLQVHKTTADGAFSVEIGFRICESHKHPITKRTLPYAVIPQNTLLQPPANVNTPRIPHNLHQRDISGSRSGSKKQMARKDKQMNRRHERRASASEQTKAYAKKGRRSPGLDHLVDGLLRAPRAGLRRA